MIRSQIGIWFVKGRKNVSHGAVTKEAFRYDSNTTELEDLNKKTIALTISLHNSRVRIVLGEVKEGDRTGGWM